MTLSTRCFSRFQIQSSARSAPLRAEQAEKPGKWVAALFPVATRRKIARAARLCDSRLWFKMRVRNCPQEQRTPHDRRTISERSPPGGHAGANPPFPAFPRASFPSRFASEPRPVGVSQFPEGCRHEPFPFFCLPFLAARPLLSLGRRDGGHYGLDDAVHPPLSSGGDRHPRHRPRSARKRLSDPDRLDSGFRGGHHFHPFGLAHSFFRSGPEGGIRAEKPPAEPPDHPSTRFLPGEPDRRDHFPHQQRPFAFCGGLVVGGDLPVCNEGAKVVDSYGIEHFQIVPDAVQPP